MIRLATQEDAALVQAIYAPYCATPISFEETPPSVAEISQRLEKVLAHYPWLVCANGDTILGYAYASRHRERAAYRWSVDTSAYVSPQHHRRGIARALYTSLIQILTLQGLYNAYAGVTLPNPASVGLHQAVGFEPVGVYQQVGYKCGAWHDVAWFQRTLQPRPAQPRLARTLLEVRQLPEWSVALTSGVGFLQR
jgi:phosphinothricin acetyltransferase